MKALARLGAALVCVLPLLTIAQADDVTPLGATNPVNLEKAGDFASCQIGNYRCSDFLVRCRHQSHRCCRPYREVRSTPSTPLDPRPVRRESVPPTTAVHDMQIAYNNGGTQCDHHGTGCRKYRWLTLGPGV
jgi:hypothetical protein